MKWLKKSLAQSAPLVLSAMHDGICCCVSGHYLCTPFSHALRATAIPRYAEETLFTKHFPSTTVFENTQCLDNRSCDCGLALIMSECEQQDTEDSLNKFSGGFMDETLVFGISKVNHLVRGQHVKQWKPEELDVCIQKSRASLTLCESCLWLNATKMTRLH